MLHPSRRIFLTGALAALMPGRLRADPGTGADSVFVWRDAHPDFGGFSALHLGANRLDLRAVTDRGMLFDARLTRDASGAITGARITGARRLTGPDGAPLTGRDADAEGIAIGADGTLFISFEGVGPRTRVLAWDPAGGPARTLPRHADWDRLPGNAGLEALAIDARGRLHAVPETPRDGAFPVYRLSGGAWSVLGRVPQAGGFVPVAADFGPDGALYLLERRFILGRFASRIRRIVPPAWDRPETLIETAPGTLDNHEGLHIGTDGAGRLIATTISDDNRFFLQRTEIAEFVLG